MTSSSLLNESLRQELHMLALMALKGEIACSPTARLWDGDITRDLVLQWLDRASLNFTKSVLLFDTATPDGSSPFEVDIDTENSTEAVLVAGKSNLQNDLYITMENAGLLRVWRSKLLALKSMQMLYQSPTRSHAATLDDPSVFGGVVSMIYGWLEKHDLVQPLRILKQEVKNKYNVEVLDIGLDLEEDIAVKSLEWGRPPNSLNELI